MENLYFNIPTVISHSYFILSNEVVHMSEKEINYFYSLLYLFRENMKDESKVKIFVKNGKKHSVSDDFENITVRIELSQFNDLGVVSNNTYEDLKNFIQKLQNREIVINSLGKDKRLDIQPLKMIEEYEIDKNILYLTLNDDFLFLFLHTQKYYMKVDLNILFKIKGYKSKKLYLFIKDYSLFKNKCIKISKENLENLIGKIPSKNRFQKDIENVNTVIYKDKNKNKDISDSDENKDKNISDLDIEYPTIIGRKLKKYEFKFKDLVKKETDKDSDSKKEIPKEIKEAVDKRIERKIKKGEQIDNLDGYKQKSYQSEMKKLQPKEKTDIEIKIDNFIDEEKSKHHIDISKGGNPKIIINGMWWINNSYLIKNPFGEKLTQNPTETLEKIENGSLVFTVEYSNGYSDDMKKMYFLTDSELRKRGLV